MWDWFYRPWFQTYTYADMSYRFRMIEEGVVAIVCVIALPIVLALLGWFLYLHYRYLQKEAREYREFLDQFPDRDIDDLRCIWEYGSNPRTLYPLRSQRDYTYALEWARLHERLSNKCGVSKRQAALLIRYVRSDKLETMKSWAEAEKALAYCVEKEYKKEMFCDM